MNDDLPKPEERTRLMIIGAVARAAFAAALVGATMACGDGSSREQVEACAQRGIAHFRETGSYPRLIRPAGLLRTWPAIAAHDRSPPSDRQRVEWLATTATPRQQDP